MAITIQLATFSKREDSTAQYTGTWTDFSCTLKENCSVIEPRVELHTATNVTAFNYAHIPAFNRYYFIRDIQYYREEVIIHLECDVLATYKSTIGSSSEYILRSASNYDGDIIDTLYPTKGNTDLILGDFTPVGNPFDSNNITFILGFLNNNQNNKFGAVQYYAMTKTEIGKMMAYLMGTPDETVGIALDILSCINVMSSQDLKNAVSRSILKPGDYIVESYMLPYKPPIASSGQAVKINWFNTGATGDVISSNASEFFITSGSLDLPDHPQKNDRGPYTNLSPFMKYWLYLGPFGTYPLDALTVYNNRTVTFSIDGDLLGNITCKLFVDSKQIDVLHANVKCNFPVGQTTMDVSRAIGSNLNVAQSVGRIAMGDPSGIISGVSGIANAVDAMLPVARSNGSQGTFVNVFDQFYSYAEAHWIVDDDNTHRGRPLCQQKTISSLSGYILVSDADISIAGTKQESEQIKSYMNSGFYYE